MIEEGAGSWDFPAPKLNKFLLYGTIIYKVPPQKKSAFMRV